MSNLDKLKDIRAVCATEEAFMKLAIEHDLITSKAEGRRLWQTLPTGNIPSEESEKPQETEVPTNDDVTEREYPRLCKLGVYCADGHVNGKELDAAMEKAGMDVQRFNAMLGVVTMSGRGPYAHDCEAVLERMISGKLTGTQLFWD